MLYSNAFDVSHTNKIFGLYSLHKNMVNIAKKSKFLTLYVAYSYSFNKTGKLLQLNSLETVCINILVLHFVENGRYEYCYNESWVLTELITCIVSLFKDYMDHAINYRFLFLALSRIHTYGKKLSNEILLLGFWVMKLM